MSSLEKDCLVVHLLGGGLQNPFLEKGISAIPLLGGGLRKEFQQKDSSAIHRVNPLANRTIFQVVSAQELASIQALE